jgi:hypothetical protein
MAIQIAPQIRTFVAVVAFLLFMCPSAPEALAGGDDCCFVPAFVARSAVLNVSVAFSLLLECDSHPRI